MSLFRGLKIYTVHTDPNAERPYESAKFVREGFNFAAFIFTGFWALYHRLWWHFLAIILINAGLYIMGNRGIMSADYLALIQLGIQFIIGSYGNDWVRWRLMREGFALTDIAASDSKLGAEQRYFDRCFSQHSHQSA